MIEEVRIRTTPAGIKRHFVMNGAVLVALEVGTHSPWSSRILLDAGHEVIVANARNFSLIHSSSRKNDQLDAERFARLARLDAKLLSPILHRGVKAQADLARIRSRDALVQTRTSLARSIHEWLVVGGFRGVGAGFSVA